jgi:hypothetical protein
MDTAGFEKIKHLTVGIEYPPFFIFFKQIMVDSDSPDTWTNFGNPTHFSQTKRSRIFIWLPLTIRS